MAELDLRPAELAGRWYPDAPEACDVLLRGARPTAIALESAVGAIVPHAGWVYSGAVAFEALSALADKRPDADLVVLFGGHLRPRDAPRVFLSGGWQTPYGPLAIAEDLAQDLSMALERADIETPEEYYDDNAVEVLVPLVKKLWPDAPALVLGIPPTGEAGRIGAEVAAAVRARGYARPVYVGSTDLTHYGPNYRFNPAGRGPGGLAWVKEKNDPEIIEQMAALDYAKTLWVAQRSRNACCAGAVAAAMVAARKEGATRGEVTRYTTSYDEHPTDPVPMSFVGYVGMVLGR